MPCNRERKVTSMTIEDALFDQFERDGWPISLLELIEEDRHRSLESCIREWLRTNVDEEVHDS